MFLLASNWNDQRAVYNNLVAQLVNVELEMCENINRLSESNDYMKSQVQNLRVLRAFMAARDESISDDKIYSNIWSSIVIYAINMRETATEAMQSSALFVRTAAPELIDALARWNDTVRRLRREQEDCLSSRNTLVIPYILAHFPNGSMAQIVQAAADFVAPSQYRLDRKALAGNWEFDNRIVARQVCVVQDLSSIEAPSSHGHRIIESIALQRKSQ